MPPSNEKQIIWHQPSITKQDREALYGHRAVALWFTGLSGSGKSTLAHEVERKLYHRGCHTYVLDGDNVRHGLNSDLGFSPQDRAENIRRLAELVRLFTDAGVIVLTAFISPYRADREKARHLLAPGDFFEIYCRCSLAVCEQRDPKGLYKKARAGDIQEFTGISAPYEEPLNPEITVDTDKESCAACTDRIIGVLEAAEVFKRQDCRSR
ncbi:MAG: adenylyl-sulfate kinase [Desulfobacterota bacterium]|nr:adenylyl-sulfate kinase [Thermodesulfobacteriota bacterium]